MNSESELISQVKKILSENEQERENIKSELSKKSSTNHNYFIFDELETKNIFHINEIKTLCVDYRLRFLSSHYFKGQIPEEAISKIRALEKFTKPNYKDSKLLHLLNCLNWKTMTIRYYLLQSAMNIIILFTNGEMICIRYEN
ncbi:hypothetical protein [Flavobacterium piscinae]|uniref:hypothetical protein n=1 Tax=Flavobacterium piscinae TaxID=2506424 RepID=UPI002AAAC1E9|nr:hypothetical protein [Flavobacterium piscinae]